VPFFRLIRVVAPSNVSPLETNAHLVYVDILATGKETREHFTQMFKQRGNSPEWVIPLLHLELRDTILGRIDHV